jgi:hypothetical protein
MEPIMKWTAWISALSSLGFLIVGILALYGAWRTYRLEVDPVLFLDCHTSSGQTLVSEMKNNASGNDFFLITDQPQTVEGNAVVKKFGPRYLTTERLFHKLVSRAPWKSVGDAYKCTLNNYGRSPAFDITLSGTAQLRLTETPADFVPSSFDYPADTRGSDMLNVASNGSTVFYILNDTPLYATVIPENTASIWRWGKPIVIDVNFSSRTLSDNELSPETRWR